MKWANQISKEVAGAGRGKMQENEPQLTSLLLLIGRQNGALFLGQ